MNKNQLFDRQINQLLHQQLNDQFYHQSLEPFQIQQLLSGDDACIEPLYKGFCNNSVVLCDDPVRSKRYLLISTLTLLSRYSISVGVNKEDAYTSSDFFIRKSDSCRSIADLEKLFLNILTFYIKKIKQAAMSHYSSPVSQAIHYISDHIYDTLTISEICQQVGYSQSYFSALFKKEMGTSLSKYIQTKKIEEACHLLLFSDDSIIEISAILAFSSSSHFSNMFRKLTGKTPQHYRETTSPESKTLLLKK